MNEFVCKRLRMYTYLVERGFTPVQTLPDINNPAYKMFLFEKTPDLCSAVEQYFTVDCHTAKQKVAAR